MTRRIVALGVVFLATAIGPAQDPYGTATAGPGGIEPVLTCGQPWMGNLGFSCLTSQGLGGATMLIMFSAQPASFSFGSTLVLIDPNPPNMILSAVLPLSGGLGVPGAGSASFGIPIALVPNPLLAGLQIYAQSFVDDPANPGVYAATRGVQMELGYPPLVFVGTSVGGSADPFYLVDPITQTVVHQGGGTYTDNVSGAVFAHGGKDLYVSTVLGHQISWADVTGPVPVWNPLYVSPLNVFYGIGHDKVHDRVYSLTGASPGPREIVAIDSNPSSATFGQLVGNTVGLAGGSTLERWALSKTGKLAAVPAIFGSGGTLYLVDTNPTSATYMTSTISSVVPGTFGFAFSVDAGFTPNDEYAIVLISGLGTQLIARFHIPSQSWVDHDPVAPGTQHIDLGTYIVPVGMQMSPDGKFAFATGLGGGSAGWVLRVDMDPALAPAYSITPILPASGLLAGAYAASLSPDGTRGAFTSTTPAKLILVDPATGALQANIPLPGASNIYTSEWR